MFVDRKNIEETDVHHFVADASELNWPVAMDQWPNVIEVRVGNLLPMVKKTVVEDGYAVYVQDLGCVQLVVFND